MKIMRCASCGTYTLKDACPKCSGKAKTAHPPSFSPQDKYGKYRRAAKLNAEPKADNEAE